MGEFESLAEFLALNEELRQWAVRRGDVCGEEGAESLKDPELNFDPFADDRIECV